MRFSGSANQDIQRWIDKGLIDAAKAAQLKDEISSNNGGFGLGGILSILGAVLIGSALLTLIASNWESFPRIGRVVLVFAAIALGYMIGAWREIKGDTVFAQVFYLVSAIAFGGGIALIGQMYHLSGDAASAALVWTLGTLSGAILLRSFALSQMSGVIGLFYVSSAFSEQSWHSGSYLWVGLLIAVIVAIVSRWNNSRAGLHTAAWMLLALCAFYRFSSDSFSRVQPIDMLFAFGGAALFFAMAFWESTLERITNFAQPLLAYTLALSFSAFAVIQVFDSYQAGSVAIYGLIVIAISVAALMLKGQDHRNVRVLCYCAFGAEILYLASVTIGSLLGTSAFFLVAGVIVLIIAYLVVRIEKQIKSTPRSVSAGVSS